MKIGLAQIRQIVGDFEGNLSRIERAVAEARSKGAALCVFPEMAACGAFAMDLLLQDRFVSNTLDLVDRLAARTRDVGVIIGYVRPSPVGAGLENTAALLYKGEIVSTHVKTRLSWHGDFDEARYFVSSESVRTVEFLGRRLAITLCDDICQPRFGGPRSPNPVAAAVQEGAEVIINISARPFVLGSSLELLQRLERCALEHSRPVLHTNMVGGSDEWVFDGGAAAISADGRLIDAATRFKTEVRVVDIESAASCAAPASDTAAEILKALTVGTRDFFQTQDGRHLLIALTDDLASLIGAVIAADAVGGGRVVGVSLAASGAGSALLELTARTLGIQYLRYDPGPWRDAFRKEIAALVTQAVVRTPSKLDLSETMANQLLYQMIARFNGFLFVNTETRTDIALNGPAPFIGGFAMLKDVSKTMLLEMAKHLRRHRPIPEQALTPKAREERYSFKTKEDDRRSVSYETVDRIIDLCLSQGYALKTLVAQGIEESLVHHVLERLRRHEICGRQVPPGIRIHGIDCRRIPFAHRWNGF